MSTETFVNLGEDAASDEDGSLATAAREKSPLESVEEAKKAAQELIALANIQRIVCVDDYYSITTDDVFEVVAAIERESLDREILLTMATSHPDLAELSEEDLPADLAAEIVRGAWETLDVDARSEISTLVRNHLGPQAIDADAPPNEDANAMVMLRNLLADPPEFLTLTLDEWRQQSAGLLGDDISTLLLFDRGFEREGASDTAGEAEIQRVLQGDHPHWRVALLTHTVTNPDEEIEAWRHLSAEFAVDAAKFLVIAKGHLSREPGRFPAMLKLTLLVPALERMQEIVANAIRDTWSHALEQVQAKDPYTLETALNGNRHLDGTWGPDTLLRLISAFTQDRVLASLRRDPELHRHNSAILSLNTVNMPLQRDQTRIKAELAEMQRMEFFKESEHLSELHLPLEVGDIFQVRKFTVEPASFEANRSSSTLRRDDIPQAAPSKYYMLLGQPCDLSVRHDGSRANDLEYLRLAPIRLLSPEVSVRAGGGSSHAFELPFFDAATGAGVQVELNRVRIVAANALDFCVFGKGGTSSLSAKDTCPDTAIPAWAGRFKDLQKWVSKTVAQYERMTPHKIPGKGANAVTVALTQSGTMPGLSSLISISNQEVHFGITRVGRLREPYRAAVLTRLAQRDSRDAFEVDLVD
ncbi:hypothetical protein ACIP98_19825 [Streptomyces sp. NPDC088354]|uniref:hypothetical protein n=1 Tax=Streptomyces sp. NPDC088354 TaxID=3365856 RepID=UPI0038255051